MFNFLITHSPLFYLTQSFWRDEAFSVLLAERPVSFIISHTDLEPPLYYLLLHFWMKIFGSSELAVRGLSFSGFLLATLIVGVWAEKLFKQKALIWFLPLSFFLNPMLIYYGFEARAYGWYILFTVASLYSYWGKKWFWYVASTTLGFYTHSYFIFVPLTQAVHWLITEKPTVKKLLHDPFPRAAALSGVLLSPWLIRTLLAFGQLKTSWYFPVDWHLVRAVLGNMFLGYEGTPWFLWNFTGILSLILLIIFVISLLPRLTRNRNLLFFLLVFLPLVVVIGISFKKPLFVNRYVIPVTIAEVFLVSFFIESVKNKFIRSTLITVNLIFLVWFNGWYPLRHPKLDIRTPVNQINELKSPQDLIYVSNPLVFYETLYYSQYRNHVFWYNPGHAVFPWYIGNTIYSVSEETADLPTYPTRAYLINEKGNFEIVYQAPLTKTLPEPKIKLSKP